MKRLKIPVSVVRFRPWAPTIRERLLLPIDATLGKPNRQPEQREELRRGEAGHLRNASSPHREQRDRCCLVRRASRDRASVDGDGGWLHWQSAHLGPAISRIAFERFAKPITGQGATDAAAVALARRDLKHHCRVLEAALIDREYIARRLTVADFALACMLNTGAIVGLDLRAFPRASSWLKRMLARESLERALAEARAALREMYARDEFSRPVSS